MFAAWAYIAEDSRPAADAVEARLVDSAVRLTEYPLLGKRGRLSGTREFPVRLTSFALIYRVSGAKVSIARVLHQRQKYP